MIDVTDYAIKLAADYLEDEKTSPLTDAAALGGAVGLSNIIGTTANGISHLFNVAEQQAIPTGEAFADFAIEQAKKLKSNPDILYLQSIPRTAGELSGGNKLVDFLVPPPAFVQSMKRTPDGTLERIGKKGARYPAEQLQYVLSQELSGRIPADKLKKNPLLALSSVDDLARDLENSTHMIVSPRNNTSILAHEMGHIYGEDLLHAPASSNILNKAKQQAADLWDLLGGSTDTFMRKTPGLKVLSEKFDNLKIRPSIKNSLRNVLFSAPPLATAGALLTLSPTVRDTIKKVAPAETTDNIMDFISEHPVAIMAAASAPALLHEAYTMIPGTKLTYNFWDKVNKGGIKSLAQLQGKVNPLTKSLGFIGRNSLPLIGAAAPLLSVALASKFLNSDSDNGSEV